MFIKICGITNLNDAESAINAGANALGFMFVRQSPRFVTPEIVSGMSRLLPPHIARVGLFVNAPLDEVRRVADVCELTLVQLHGEESPAYCRSVGRPVLKAFRVKDSASLRPMRSFDVSAYLLDAYVPGKSGGTGETFDWEHARAAAAQYRVVLAGGLTPDNVGSAIRQVNPYGVDVSSNVEASPGVKDPQKMRAFVHSAKEAWNALD